MSNHADGSVIIRTSSESVPSTPSWFGEAVLMAAHLRKHSVLTKIAERVHFTRRRFGRYETIDFLVVLFGYAISGERTLEAFYERLRPFAVPFQRDGTLRCPAGNALIPQERRREADGSLRVVYAASMRNCRPCPLREQCQWQGSATKKPRQVGVLLHPVVVGSEPIRWHDWSRRSHRRACIQLVRYQCVKVEVEPPTTALLTGPPAPLSRAQRAHYRLSWEERLARNARVAPSGQVTIRLFGIPEPFATSLGLATA